MSYVEKKFGEWGRILDEGRNPFGGGVGGWGDIFEGGFQHLGLFTSCSKYHVPDSTLFDIRSINLILQTSPSLPLFTAKNFAIGHLFCSDSSFNSLISPTVQFFHFGEFYSCWF